MKSITRDVEKNSVDLSERLVPVYVLDPTENCLVIDHYEDQQAIIDSYAEDVAIDRIMARHALGDESIINAKKPINDIEQEGDLDLTFLQDVKDPSQLAKLQAHYLLSLYENYKGDKNLMTFDKFVKAVNTGDYQSLNTKKEETNNA